MKMNKKNYILNNASTKYFEYFFLKKLKERQNPSVVNYLYLVNDTNYGIDFTYKNKSGQTHIIGKATASDGRKISYNTGDLEAGTYTLTLSKALPFLINFSIEQNVAFRIPAGTTSITTTLTKDYVGKGDFYMVLVKDQEYDETFTMILTKDS